MTGKIEPIRIAESYRHTCPGTELYDMETSPRSVKNHGGGWVATAKGPESTTAMMIVTHCPWCGDWLKTPDTAKED